MINSHKVTKHAFNTPHIPSSYSNEQTTKNKGYKQLIYIYISHVNVTQTVPDISPLMPMHQDPLLVRDIMHNMIVYLPPRLVQSAGD